MPQAVEALAQRERTALQQPVVGALGEDEVFQRLDLLVEGLRGIEVAVDEIVEEAVQQEPGAALGEVGVAVPTFDESVDVGDAVVVHGDQRVVGDERGKPDRDEGAAHRIEADAAGGHHAVSTEVQHLWPLVTGGGFDGERVQAELDGDRVEFGLRRRVQVEPQHDGGIPQAVREVVDHGVLGFENAVTV